MSMPLCMSYKKAQNVAFQNPNQSLLHQYLRWYFCLISGMTGGKILSCETILKKNIKRILNQIRSRDR